MFHPREAGIWAGGRTPSHGTHGTHPRGQSCAGPLGKVGNINRISSWAAKTHFSTPTSQCAERPCGPPPPAQPGKLFRGAEEFPRAFLSCASAFSPHAIVSGCVSQKVAEHREIHQRMATTGPRHEETYGSAPYFPHSQSWAPGPPQHWTCGPELLCGAFRAPWWRGGWDPVSPPPMIIGLLSGKWFPRYLPGTVIPGR